MKQCPMYLNGEFAASRGGKWFPVFDPSTEEVIAEVADGDAADVERGVAAARKLEVELPIEVSPAYCDIVIIHLR